MNAYNKLFLAGKYDIGAELARTRVKLVEDRRARYRALRQRLKTKRAKPNPLVRKKK